MALQIIQVVLAIATLRYRLLEDFTVSFETAAPVEAETDAFYVRLEDALATFTMKEHHASVPSARQVVDPFVLGWEIRHCLWAGLPEIHF